jgi:hypothetical protein
MILSFLPASLVSSILYFILEVYAIARVMILVSTGVSVRHVIRDVRLLRPLSLLLVSNIRERQYTPPFTGPLARALDSRAGCGSHKYCGGVRAIQHRCRRCSRFVLVVRDTG